VLVHSTSDLSFVILSCCLCGVITDGKGSCSGFFHYYFLFYFIMGGRRRTEWVFTRVEYCRFVLVAVVPVLYISKAIYEWEDGKENRVRR